MIKLKEYFQIISCLFFSLLGLQIKLLSSSVNIETIVFFRSLLGSFFVFFFIVIFKEKKFLKKFKKKNIKIHALRSICGIFAMYFGYKSLEFISLSQASTIGFTKVFFTSLLAVFIFKERFHTSNIFFIFLGFLGVYLITDPTNLKNTFGISLSLLSALFVSGGILSISYLSKKEETLKILFYNSIISSIIFFTVFFEQINFFPIQHFLKLMALTITAILGQYFNTESYKYFKTSKVVLMSYSRILFATLFGFFFLDESINLTSFIGIIFVIITTLIVKSKIIKN